MSPLDLAGRRALVLHRADHHRAALSAQLHRVGLVVCCLPPSTPLGQIDADFVFFDADVGHDCLFPWGRSPPPMPLVAILGTEAPGRLEWALAQSATAFMSKPIGSSGAFQALVVAARLHEQIGELRRSVAELSERLRARPLVVRAVLEVMRRQRLDEAEALNQLRRAAMSARISIEALCASIAATPALAARLSDPPRLSARAPANADPRPR